MSLLVDANLSHHLPGLLADVMPGMVHVRPLGIEDADDEVLWEYAITNGLAVLTRDSDFRHRSFLRGHPPKVIWVCVLNGRTAYIEALIRRRIDAIRAFLASPGEAVFVLT